jgi:2-hydroxy-6-oxonona-2,4-dienedioate hydrolase
MGAASLRTSLTGGPTSEGDVMMRDDCTPASAWATVRGVRMHYRFSSDAVTLAPMLPVVLVHGLSVSSAYLLPTMRALAGRVPFYAPDLPGFGKSEKPAHVLDVPELADALGAWMDALGLGRAHLLGHSLGAQIVVDLASRQPSRVASLILAGPTTDPRAPSVWRQALRLLRDMPRETPSFWPVVATEYLAAGPRRTLGTMRAGIRDPFVEKLPGLRLPLLVVRGSRDPIAPEAWTEEIASLAPGARRATILGGPHAVNFNNPEQLAEMIVAFTRDYAEGGERRARTPIAPEGHALP